MSEEYYIRTRGIVTGPFSLDELAEEARNGRFGVAHEVKVGNGNWSSARTIIQQFALSTNRRESYSETFPKRNREHPSSGDVPPISKDEPPLRNDPRPKARQRPSFPVKSIRDPIHDFDWNWTKNGVPVPEAASLVEMIEKIQTGQLNPFEFVRSGPDEEWRRADDVPEFEGAWDTPALKWRARSTLVVAVLILFVYIPASTAFVWRWARSVDELGYWPWCGLSVSLALAIGATVVGILGFQEWARQGSPRSRERVWLIGGWGGSIAVILSSLIMILARGLTNLFTTVLS